MRCQQDLGQPGELRPGQPASELAGVDVKDSAVDPPRGDRLDKSCGACLWELVFRAMGVIDVRRFHVATYWDSGELGVADVSLVDEDMWDIDLAEVVKVTPLRFPRTASSLTA